MEVGNPSLWRGIFLQVNKVLETVAATKDLENIIGYITGNLYNFTAAKDFIGIQKADYPQYLALL